MMGAPYIGQGKQPLKYRKIAYMADSHVIHSKVYKQCI